MLLDRITKITSLSSFIYKSPAVPVSWTTSRGAGSLSSTTATGVNYFKKGEDPPLKDDKEYPDWLWKVHEPSPTVYSLQKKAAGDGDLESGDISAAEVKQLIKMENNRSIKDRNFIKAKG
ncbi:g6675 [Coccomyxa elongata]